jgi:16S rRNA (adenine1518-N6/adenine1519-N6)-dimethyltransferase
VRIRARKRFGQHFLHDPGVVDRIVAAIAARPGQNVVEIGPGRGVLTHSLLAATGGALDAIEIDRDLAALLRTELASSARFVLHEADALDFDFGALARERGGRLRIVGNLPYNVSTPLLFHLLASASHIEDMHVMLQREVVKRLAASPGSSDYGRLTVMLAPWVQVEALFDVGPGAFRPPPAVWSSVARLVVRSKPSFEVSPKFAAVVAAAFSHRRKTLRNAVRELVPLENILACSLDPGVRPETLAPEAFNALARSIESAPGALSTPGASR